METTQLTQEEKNMAMLCHLGAFAGWLIPFGGIIVPLVIWLSKRDESAFIDFHGRESVNFQLSMLIYVIIGIALSFILIGIPMLIALVIFELVVIIVATIHANDGKHYHYPMSLRLIK